MSARRAKAEAVAALLSWPPQSEKFRLLAGALLALFAVYALTFLVVTGRRMAGPPSGDFFALWSAARFILEHPAGQVYDPAQLKAYQVALGMAPATDYPFPYPPSLLLVLWPIGLLAYLPAYVLTIGATLGLFLWATVGRDWRWPTALAAAVAPTTTITIVAGQLGFLTAALLAGGLRLLPRRPWLAGVLFGLLTYKPQMGLLLPVALVAAGAWRTIAAACLTLAMLVMLSSVVFGPGIWPAWAASLDAYAREFASAAGGKLGHLMPTVEAASAQLGLAPPIAGLVQAAAAGVAAVAVWRCFRHAPGALAGAALLVAAFLATPHALVYDMPPLATAVLWLIRERRQAGGAFGTGEVLVMMTAMIAPITLVAGAAAVPLVPLSLALLLAVIVRRCERAGA